MSPTDVTGSGETIGLLGGMSWLSTIPYYRIINQMYAAALGGLHSAPILLLSVDFQEIETLQRAGHWDDAGRMLALSATSLERGGADFLVLCTNTMHRVYEQIESAVEIPLLHIADATAEAISAAAVTRVGLIGTRFTMEESFYRARLVERHGLDVLVPSDDERETIHRTIYEELCRGEIRSSSRAGFMRIAERLVGRGARGLILGCTEIGLLLGADDVDVPVFDTARLHAEAAARRSLASRSVVL